MEPQDQTEKAFPGDYVQKWLIFTYDICYNKSKKQRGVKNTRLIVNPFQANNLFLYLLRL